MTRLRGLTVGGTRRVVDLLRLSRPNLTHPGPADPLASASATNLLNRLHQYRGLYVLAGQQQGDDGGDQDGLVEANTGGRRPAIRGYDRFIGGVVAGNATTQLDQMIADWNAVRVIPTISLHWTPSVNTEVPPGDPALDDAVSLVDIFNSGTTVGARYALWKLNLGDDLAVLASAGVPVLFRPWHEAGGSWFWWSQGTAEQYRALWIDLFTYLTVTRSIHNCLWVFSASWNGLNPEWYPGDRYVDVVGVDLYDVSNGDYTTAYQAMARYGASGTPRAMTEAGWVPSMSTFSTAPVSWALMWTGSFLTQNGPTNLTAFYSDARTVTRTNVSAFINGTLA